MGSLATPLLQGDSLPSAQQYSVALHKHAHIKANNISSLRRNKCAVLWGPAAQAASSATYQLCPLCLSLPTPAASPSACVLPLACHKSPAVQSATMR